MYIEYSVFMNDLMRIPDKQIKIYIIRYDIFIQNFFFHKYSLVGCQQNLVVFIFFDYSGL